MRKKKVLVHGTPDSLQKFFSDAVSYDYDVVAVLSAENFSIELDDKELEVFAPQALPKLVYSLVDGIIITDAVTNSGLVKTFLKLGTEPRKIILWNEQQGWGNLELSDKDGTPVIYFCGLEFHLRNNDDVNFFNGIFWRLQNQWQVRNVSPELYPALLVETFQQRMGAHLDLNNLRTFTEKMQWLKVYDATPLKSRLADKYLVRRWVADKIGEQYLIPLLGVWDEFDDIDFDELPDQFVLKCNHGWNMNIIVRDKKSFDVQRAREKINAWLAINYGAQLGLEVHYSRIKRKIIAEKFLSDGKNLDVNDYKFWCFNGHVKYVQVDRNRSTNHVQKFYSTDWKSLSFIIDGHTPDNKIAEKPLRLEEMLNIAEKLSADFNIVRVDLYCLKDKIYFGEMTFTPLNGYVKWLPEGTDEYLGTLLTLPEPTPPPKL